MTKEGSAKIVNFITIGTGGLMRGRGYMSHYCEYALSSTLSIYITLSDCYSVFYATVHFHLFYDVAADMQLCAPLTRSH